VVLIRPRQGSIQPALDSDLTATIFASENGPLLRNRLPPLRLLVLAFHNWQRASVLEIPTQHFFDQGVVTLPQGRQLPYPSESFGVMSVAFSSLGQNCPNAMQFPVLA